MPRLGRDAVTAAPVRRRGPGLTRPFLRFKAGLQQERPIETEVFSDGKGLMVVVCTRGGAQTGLDIDISDLGPDRTSGRMYISIRASDRLTEGLRKG